MYNIKFSYRQNMKMTKEITLILMSLYCSVLLGQTETNPKIDTFIDKYECDPIGTTVLQPENLSPIDRTCTYVRIPFMEITNKGTLLCGCDSRSSNSDQSLISCGLARSTDNGNHWTYMIANPHTAISKLDRRMDSSILCDRTNNKLFIFSHKITGSEIWERINTDGNYSMDCVFVTSNDDGKTWSKEISLRDVITTNGEKGSYGKYVVTLFGGVGKGITLQDGTLVLPIQCKMATETAKQDGASGIYNIQSGLIYSTDHGNTWKRCSSLVPCYSSECQLIELANGGIMINCRSYIGHRRVFITHDLGNTWVAHTSDRSLIEPTACEGSLGRLSLAKYAGGFVNPNDSTARKNITLQVTNDFTNWRPLVRLSSIKSEGYSAIAGYGGKNYALIEQNNKIVLFDLNPYVR